MTQNKKELKKDNITKKENTLEKELIIKGEKSMKKKSNTLEKDGIVYYNGKLYKKETVQKIRKYQDEYMKNTYRRYTLRMSYTKDQDVIEMLAKQPSANDYIRQLIKQDVARQNEGKEVNS